MNTTNILFLAIFLISAFQVLLPVPATNVAAYSPTEVILLDCGSNATSNTISSDGRMWVAGTPTRFLSSFNQKNSSYNSISPIQVPVPYLSALVIESEFTFTFPLSPGSKFLRLYFYPQNYSNLDISTSFFSVTVNNQILMKNFSAYLTAPAMDPPSNFLFKEFIVTVWENQVLNVTFTPVSPTSFAFINAIEIVSMPNSLYLPDKEIPFVVYSIDDTSTKLLDNTTTLEAMYRLKVGGSQIENMNDTGMYRTWGADTDGNYLRSTTWTEVVSTSTKIQFAQEFPAYTAPKEVYLSSRAMTDQASFNLRVNMTWIFPVDAGFFYLVRLHFCEILLEVTEEYQHLVNIFINRKMAERYLDVFKIAGGDGFAMYRDYIVWADNEKQGKELWLELQPVNAKFTDAFLNGLEIFKLNSTDGSLAWPNPDPIPQSEMPPSSRSPKDSRHGLKSVSIIFSIIVIGFVLFLLLLTFFICRRKRKLKKEDSTTKTSFALPSDLFRRFSIAEIKDATHDFNQVLLIGRGGFGNVYKGIIVNGTTTVAVKRLNPSSRQGANEFSTEISMLSTLRHPHLVSLLGYCDEKGEMILVYDYMRLGALNDHLYKTENPPLSWKRRLEICIGAARGLHYLHKEAKQCIIHRDVKSSNILLDENFVAKISDFGISKLGPTSTTQTHVSTLVKGSFGYLDPEYYLSQQLREKSDVYSFGVVLFEVLCGRPPVIQGLPREQVSLAHWAQRCYLKGTLNRIVDPYLTGQISPIALKKFGEVAERCVRDHGIERPSMSDIVCALEFTLELQEAADKNTDGSDAIKTYDEIFSNTSDSVAQSKTSDDSGYYDD